MKQKLVETVNNFPKSFNCVFLPNIRWVKLSTMKSRPLAKVAEGMTTESICSTIYIYRFWCRASDVLKVFFNPTSEEIIKAKHTLVVIFLPADFICGKPPAPSIGYQLFAYPNIYSLVPPHPPPHPHWPWENI